MLALIHEVLSHRRTSVRCDVLKWCRVGAAGGNHDGVIKRTVLSEHFNDAGDGRSTLTAGHVDADNASALLVQNRVNRNRGFTGLAVADDEFSLATTDGSHRVDGLNSGLERFLHRLTLGDPGRLPFDRPRLGSKNRTLAVKRIAERVDHASKQRGTDRDRQQLAR